MHILVGYSTLLFWLIPLNFDQILTFRIQSNYFYSSLSLFTIYLKKTKKAKHKIGKDCFENDKWEHYKMYYAWNYEICHYKNNKCYIFLFSWSKTILSPIKCLMFYIPCKNYRHTFLHKNILVWLISFQYRS